VAVSVRPWDVDLPLPYYYSANFMQSERFASYISRLDRGMRFGFFKTLSEISKEWWNGISNYEFD
jgi:hypothetical protein